LGNRCRLCGVAKKLKRLIAPNGAGFQYEVAVTINSKTIRIPKFFSRNMKTLWVDSLQVP
jgi:hypothetical protein